MKALLLASTLCGFLVATRLDAQEHENRGRTQAVPPGHLPPPGECRVWYDDRPPGHQPPPTDCASARLEARRTGGRVISGGRKDDRRYDDRYDRRDRRDDDRRRVECDDRDRRDGECRWEDRDCVDRDRDGRCDYADGRYPSSLPDMVWGIIFGRGERVEDVRRWVGQGDVRVRHVDADRNGVPEVVTWLDSRGRTLQRWIDDDRDGRADRVGIYRDGTVVRVIR